jgi:hypothetical protein
MTIALMGMRRPRERSRAGSLALPGAHIKTKYSFYLETHASVFYLSDEARTQPVVSCGMLPLEATMHPPDPRRRQCHPACALLFAGLLPACSQAHADQPSHAVAASLGSVSVAPAPNRVHRPYPDIGVNTGRHDTAGIPARVPCSTCHRSIEPRPETAKSSKIPGFHEGIVLQHGGQNCRTCHRPPAFEDFQLADGQAVPYWDVIQICTQCHGQRVTDYRNGAHGGMTGYWDPASGPKDRNHCLDCHNAHAPKIPQVAPAPRPRYRFVGGTEGHHESE